MHGEDSQCAAIAVSTRWIAAIKALYKSLAQKFQSDVRVFAQRRVLEHTHTQKKLAVFQLHVTLSSPLACPDGVW